MLLRFYALWHKQPCCTVVIDGAQFELSIRLALYRVCLRSESVHVGCLSTCPRVLIQKTCSNRGMGNFTINLISQNLEFHWIHFSWSKYSKTSLKWFVLRILNWTLRPYLISEIVFLDSALLAVCLSILVERNSHYFLSLHSEVRMYSGQVIRYTWGIKGALLPSNVEVHDMEIALWIFYWNTFFFQFRVWKYRSVHQTYVCFDCLILKTLRELRTSEVFSHASPFCQWKLRLRACSRVLYFLCILASHFRGILYALFPHCIFNVEIKLQVISIHSWIHQVLRKSTKQNFERAGLGMGMLMGGKKTGRAKKSDCFSTIRGSDKKLAEFGTKSFGMKH